MNGFHHYKKVFSEIKFNDLLDEIKPISKRINKNKLNCYQADIKNGIKPIYRISIAVKHHTHTFTPIIKDLIEKIKTYGINTNFTKTVIYENGDASIGKHSDPCVDTTIGSSFAICSFGATRKFVIENKQNKILQTINFEHGDLLIINYKENKKFFHSILKESNIKNMRIAILFKDVSTFIDSDGYVFGQGSPYKTLEEARKHNLLSKQENLKKGMDLHNIYLEQQTLEEWEYEKLYGKGFPFEFMNPYLKL